MSESESEQFAVVGPDGTLVLPAALRRRAGLEPGVTLRIVERADGGLELRPSEPRAEPAALGDFWNRWWDEVQADVATGAATGATGAVPPDQGPTHEGA